MANAQQLAEWDRTASIVWRLHNAWYKEPISPRDANPLRAQPPEPGDIRSIRHYFQGKAKP